MILNISSGKFLYKNQKKMNLLSGKIFYMGSLYVGKSNIIHVRVLVGLQKYNFLHEKSLYRGASYLGNVVVKNRRDCLGFILMAT
jgi:hypothetical protein